MQQEFPRRILYGADYNPEQWPEEVWWEEGCGSVMARANITAPNSVGFCREAAQLVYQFG